MKCRGKKCSSYDYNNYFYPRCIESNLRINTNCECGLLEKIQEVRDDLVRICRLFEEVFDIDSSDESLDELVDDME